MLSCRKARTCGIIIIIIIMIIIMMIIIIRIIVVVIIMIIIMIIIIMIIIIIIIIIMIIIIMIIIIIIMIIRTIFIRRIDPITKKETVQGANTGPRMGDGVAKLVERWIHYPVDSMTRVRTPSGAQEKPVSFSESNMLC